MSFTAVIEVIYIYIHTFIREHACTLTHKRHNTHMHTHTHTHTHYETQHTLYPWSQSAASRLVANTAHACMTRFTAVGKWLHTLPSHPSFGDPRSFSLGMPTNMLSLLLTQTFFSVFLCLQDLPSRNSLPPAITVEGTSVSYDLHWLCRWRVSTHSACVMNSHAAGC